MNQTLTGVQPFIIYQPHTAGRENTNAHTQCICGFSECLIGARNSSLLLSQGFFIHLTYLTLQYHLQKTL